jgi:hypothetical protein
MLVMHALIPSLHCHWQICGLLKHLWVNERHDGVKS